MTTVNIVSHAQETLASHRMRVMIPAEGLNTYTSFKAKISKDGDKTAGINIFHKHFHTAKNIMEATECSKAGSKVMFDICDDWFDREHGEYYEAMCGIADVITCNSPNMQARIYEVTGRLAQVCTDPITFPKYSPNKHKKKNPEIVWYGHAVNIFSAIPYVEKLQNFTIITNVALDNYSVKSKFWKPGLVEKTVDMYDIVIIPNINTPEAKNKSPNRAIDALHAGRFVIAESEEVYGELIDFIYLGPIEEGIEFYKNNPEEVKMMIKQGQQYAIDNYNHKKVCEQWVSALNYKDYSKNDTERNKY